MSAMQRRKGARIEREIVNRHREVGIHAERVPLSGAVKGKRAGNGHDVDVYGRFAGEEDPPFCCEVKAGQQIPKTILDWLADNDALFLRPDNAEPVVVVPWRIWLELLCMQGAGR
jgi:hypothetical protein